MSGLRMSTRSSSAFTSKNAFDALKVEDLASEEEQEESEPELEAQETSGSSAPLTKTAQKKLAKEKREEKKQREKEEKRLKREKEAKTNGNANGTSSNSTTTTSTAVSNTSDSNGLQPVATVQDSQQTSLSPQSSSSKAREAPVTKLSSSSSSSSSSSQSTKAKPQAASNTEKVSSAIKSSLSDGADLLAAPSKALNKMTNSDGQSEEERKKAEEKQAYWKKVYERTFFTFLMIGGFIVLLLLGHPYMILLVMISQTLVYREVTALFNIPGRPSVTRAGKSNNYKSAMSSQATSANVSEEEDAEDEDGITRGEGRRREELWSKTLSWYFFAVSNYFLYGESLIYYFKHIVFVDAYFIPFARHHRFLSFMLYVFGFVAFVAGLKRANLKHQFGLFCWVHMSLLLIVVSSHFIVNNILEGLIWFWIPASLVICNDVFAYVCGMLFGRTPLISLSPKKTVEGFVGAFLITEVFAIIWATIFQRFNYMICPAVSLGMNAFSQVQCEVNPVFSWRALPLPSNLVTFLSAIVDPVTSALSLSPFNLHSLPYTAFQLHSLVMAAFASLVAPFGGFFASGFKRAFDIKDFGDSIPGHGGLTDRFDCQFLMGLFSYVYYSSLIREHHVTVGSVLQTIVTHLTLDDQIALQKEIGRYLSGQGVRTN